MTDVLILTPAPDEPRFADSWSPLFERLAAPHVPQMGEVKPYRPEALREHVKAGAFFGGQPSSPSSPILAHQEIAVAVPPEETGPTIDPSRRKAP